MSFISYPGIFNQKSLTQLNYRNTILVDLPIAYWRLGELSGTVVADETTLYNGTYINSPTLGTSGLISGDANTAVYFNGTNYIDFGNLTAFQISKGTLECWIQTSNAGTGVRSVFMKSLAYSLILNNNILETYDWGGVAFRSTGINIADNLKHHLVMTFDSGIVDGTKIYVDGALVLTTRITISRQTRGLAAAYNSVEAPQYLTGILDEIAIYNYILSANRVTAHFNAGS